MKQRTKYEMIWNIKPQFVLDWLNAKGWAGYTLTDGFMAHMQTKGANGATLSESLNYVLTNLGYTGTLQDMKHKFYSDQTGILHPKDAELAFYTTHSLDFGTGGGVTGNIFTDTDGNQFTDTSGNLIRDTQ